VASAGTVAALVGEVADTACRVLARALEANPRRCVSNCEQLFRIVSNCFEFQLRVGTRCSPALWAVYLNVFHRRFPSKLQPLAEAALAAHADCYSLWFLVAHHQPGQLEQRSVQRRAWQALSVAPPPPPGVGFKDPTEKPF
jgi:hypothetical protein